jgi:hypothetical protein
MLIIQNFRINLCSTKAFMSEHLAYRFYWNARMDGEGPGAVMNIPPGMETYLGMVGQESACKSACEQKAKRPEPFVGKRSRR